MDKSKYMDLITTIGWFFFDLLLIGNVEDYRTGLSFSLPGLKWHFYVEVILYVLVFLTAIKNISYYRK